LRVSYIQSSTRSRVTEKWREGRETGGFSAQDAGSHAACDEAIRGGEHVFVVGEPAFGPDEQRDRFHAARRFRERLLRARGQQAARRRRGQ
jgi:hypothetical protein